MKIAVLTDVHANWPALEAALEAIKAEACDLIFHVGDVVAIGPYPAECLERMLDVTQMEFVMGNHDEWFANGLPKPQPGWMSDGEVEHQNWTHEQIDSALRVVVGQWPYAIRRTFGQVAVTFAHYGLDPKAKGFAKIVRPATGNHLATTFATERSDLIFYGHDHAVSDLVHDGVRYVNPGSLGCHKKAVARFVTADFSIPDADHPYTLTHHAIPYNDRELFYTFEMRRVPQRQFLYRIFFGNRFRR
ncbi:MAG: metallophosphoesterase family protein [Chloroflexota bacterium]